MQDNLIDAGATLLRFVVAVGMALATVAAARVAVRQSATARNAPFEPMWDEFEGHLVGALRVVILRLLLPASATLAVLKAKDASAFLLLFLAGAAATVILYALFLALYKLLGRPGFEWRGAAAASMGGGNRGLAALVLLCGVGGLSATEQEIAQGAFFALDAGNFLALLTFMPLLISVVAQPATDADASKAEKQAWKETVGERLSKARWDLAPIAISLALPTLILATPALANIEALIEHAGEETSQLRSALLLYLPWVWVFLAWPTLPELRAAIVEAIGLTAIRGMLVALGLVALSSALNTSVRELFWQPFYLAAIVLLMAPVSSLAKIICAQAGADKATQDRIGALTVSSTVVFAGTLALIVVGIALAGP